MQDYFSKIQNYSTYEVNTARASDLQPVRQRTQLAARTHTLVKKSNIYKNILESGRV